MEWRELAPEDLYGLRNPLIVDVRSPGEYEDERIPEAVNIPLFSNEERAVIGTIYKEQGDMIARRHALTIIAPKIPLVIDEIMARKDRLQSIVVHCWRGGLRSEAVSSVLSIAGIMSFRLTGGYKAWRNMVLRELKEDRFKFEPLVLYGMTGAGKTEILQELHKQGCQVVDLEEIANHRGSVFGGLGRSQQPTQKNFEAVLWNRLRMLDRTKPVFIEAESRKVGKLSLPDSILEKILHGRAALVEGSVAARTRRIADDYLSTNDAEGSTLQSSLELLEKIKASLGKTRTQEISEMAREGKVDAAIEALLLDYYDPLYARSTRNKDFELVVSGDDVVAAAKSLLLWAESVSSDIEGSTTQDRLAPIS